MDLQVFLPPSLRGPSTTFTPIAAGLSGASVYRVDAAGRALVLKLGLASEPEGAFEGRADIAARAAKAGVAPALVHVDVARRAMLTAFVTDRSFMTLYTQPLTRPSAIRLLGETLRRVHEVSLSPDTPTVDPRIMLDRIVSMWAPGLGIPAFAREATARVQGAAVPATDRPVGLSHNDVNPTNLVYDGERVVLLDWDTAAKNDPLYDLAAASVFMRMDEEACRALIEAHDGHPLEGPLPARFVYDRQLVAALAGAVFVRLAGEAGHAGDAGQRLETTASLADLYAQLRTGSLDVASPNGKWAFGLALLRESLAA